MTQDCTASVRVSSLLWLTGIATWVARALALVLALIWWGEHGRYFFAPIAMLMLIALWFAASTWGLAMARSSASAGMHRLGFFYCLFTLASHIALVYALWETVHYLRQW
mgnify:CR=1 FL=1